MVFTDGITVGAKLDRNGLRPLRYTLTSDGLLVVGSEVGIADLHGKEIAERQRLGPGEMLLCDLANWGIYPARGGWAPAEFPRSMARGHRAAHCPNGTASAARYP